MTITTEQAAATSTVTSSPVRTVRSRRLGLNAVYTCAFAFAGWIIGSGRLADNSFFWHLRTGELILDQGIPHHDPYSFTSHGIAWIAQSWLVELVYGAIDRAAGGVGIRFFGAIVGCAVAILLFRLALRITGDRLRAAGLTTVVLLTVFALWSERPLVVGLLLFVVLVWLVEAPESWLGRRSAVALPALLWLWVNIHGTFVLGFAYVALHLLGVWLEGTPPWQGRSRSLLLGAVVASVLVFANPYGAALVLFPVHLLGRGDILAHVIEWKSPDFRQFQGQALALLLVVVLIGFARGRNRVSRRDLVVLLPFVLLAFWAQRNIALTAVVALPVLARVFAVPQGERTEPQAGSGVERLLIAGLVFAIAFISMGIAGAEPFAYSGYPVQAMRVVQRDGLLGTRLASDDGWGGYIILRYWPQQRVFVDDRYDMYPTAFMHRYLDLQDTAQGWASTLRREDVQVVVWPTQAPLSQVLAKSPGWVEVHHDHTAIVFVRRDVAIAHGLG